MDHSIYVTLVAKIDQYKQSMSSATKISSDTVSAISSAFSKIQASAQNSLSGVSSSLKKTGDDMDKTGDKSDSLATKIGEGLVGAIVAATAVVGAFTAKGLQAQAVLADLAISNDLAASKIGRFEDVAARSGMTVKELGNSINSFQKAMKDAAASDSATVFDKLGVKVTDANHALRDTDQVAIEAAKAVSQLSTEAEKYDAAAKLGFAGKVQLLEDIAHATELTSKTTDEQAEAVVRLGKIWHEILPSGTSMWQDISKFFSNNLTPGLTQASVSILESKNRIVDAFNQIYGSGSRIADMGAKLKGWGEDAGKWFGDLAKSATDASLGLLKFIAAETGLGDLKDFTGATSPGFVPKQTPLATGDKTPVETENAKKLREEYEALLKTISEKIALQKEETRINDTLTEGQRLAVKVTNDQASSVGAFNATQKEQLLAQINLLSAQEKINQQKAEQRAKDKKDQDEAQKWFKTNDQNAKDRILQLAAELEAGIPLTEAEMARVKVLSEMVAKSKNLTDAQKALIKTEQDEIVTKAKLVDLEKADRERYARMAAEVQASADQTKALQDQIKYYGLTEEAVLRLKAVELERQMQNGDLDDTEMLRLKLLYKQTLDQADAQKKLTQLRADTSFWTSLEDVAHQTFMSIADGGKDLATRLRDSLKNIFFDWLYQQTLKKWIIQIGASLNGAGAVSGIAGAAGATDSSNPFSALSSGASLLTAGKMIYTGFANGVATSMGGAITSLGNTFGSEAASAFGAGMQGGALGSSTASAASGFGGTSAAGAGASFAKALPIIGWIIAGMQAANMFSQQGFKPDNGTIAPWAKPLTLPTDFEYRSLTSLGVGSTLANILSGAAISTKLFGRASPIIESQGLEGKISATGFTGDMFANILEKGGWFRSDKRYTNTAALDPAQAQAFNDQVTGMVSAVKGFGSVLGVQTSVVDGYSKDIKLVLTSDAAKNQELIQSTFGGVADDLALLIVPELAKFQQQGEALNVTLQRVTQDYAAVDSILGTIGKTFGAIGVSSIAARENLIKAAGGLDNLASGVAYFQQNFLTDAQRLAPVQKQVADALAAMGKSGLTTVEQFSAAAQAIDVTTDSGAQLFAQMLALAPAFKQVADAAAAAAATAAAAAAAQQKAAADLAAAQAAQALQNIADQAKLLTGAVDYALDGVSRAVQSQKDTITKAYDDLTTALDTNISSVTARITNLQSLSSVLQQRVTVAGAAQGVISRQVAAAAIAAATQVAQQTGVLPAAEAIKDAVTTLRADSPENYSTLLEYQRAAAASNNSISMLGDLTDTQLSVAQTTLQVLQDQKTAAKAAYDAQIKALDDSLTLAQQQVDELKGISTSVTGLPDALAALAAAIAAARANPVSGAGAATQAAYQQYLGRSASTDEVSYWAAQAAKGVNVTTSVAGSNEAMIQSLYQKYLGRTGEAAGVHAWENALAAGQTWSQIEQGFATSGEAQAHSAMLAAAVGGLTQQMQQMQNSMARTANATQQLAQQFDNVSAGGSALLTDTL